MNFAAIPLLQLRIAVALLAKRRELKLAYMKSWREAHPSRRREWTVENAEHVRKYRRNYELENLPARKAYMADWRKKNVARRQESKRRWDSEHVEHVRAKRREFARKSNYSKRPYVKLKNTIRNLTQFHLHGALKDRSTEKMLGCGTRFFQKWVESQFQPGMSWENRTSWHLDHIFPLGSCKRGDIDQLALASNYHNIRPIWGRDNCRKSSAITADSLVAAYICGVSEIHLNKNSRMSPELIAKSEKLGFKVYEFCRA